MPQNSTFELPYRIRYRQAFPVPGNLDGWVSPWHFGLNEGPTILMVKNYRTGLLWKLMRECPYIACGLRQAGFVGGWL